MIKQVASSRKCEQMGFRDVNSIEKINRKKSEQQHAKIIVIRGRRYDISNFDHPGKRSYISFVNPIVLLPKLS